MLGVCLQVHAAASGDTGTTVPFALVADNIIISVRINGIKTAAILDTGGRNVMTPELAQRLGLAGKPKTSAGGMGAARVSVSQTHVHEVAVDGVTLRDQPFLILALPYELTNGGPQPVEVDLGYELLEDYTATIDFVKSQVTFNPVSSGPDERNSKIPISFSDTTPTITATLDGISGTFLVDTGSSFGLALTSPFVAAHRITRTYRATEAGATGQGLGGETYAQLARATSLTIGSNIVTEPVMQLSTDTGGTLASHAYAGVIGIDVLRNFDAVTFDYAHRTLALQPARTSDPTAAQTYDRTGMSADKNDATAFTVSGVLPGGPAAAAGLRNGDRITAVNGVAARAVDTQQWWVLAHAQVGTVLHLVIARGGAQVVVDLRLNDVI